MAEELFSGDLYRKIGINNLILFCIYSIIKKNEKCTFECLVRECFSLFGKAFCLSGYPAWPDSRKLDRPLRALRCKKLITGSPQKYFSLTKNGRKAAEEVLKTFGQRKLKI